ncbi:hypothetical protein D3C81_2080350 [compost metagenome]
MTIPRLIIFQPNRREKMLSLAALGLCCIKSFSAWSTPRAMAGNPSVTRLTHRIWIGTSGSGIPNIMARNMVRISPTLDARR